MHAAGQWEKWKKTEPARLACYIDPPVVAQHFGSLGATHAQRSADLRQAVRQVYEHLATHKLPYETAAIDFSNFHEAEQVIRTPASIFAEGGNCLELSLLFAGMCIQHKLRTLVVLLDNHALAAVWLGGDLDQAWSTGRPTAHDHLIMSQGLGNLQRDSRANLINLVGQEMYLLVECTGITGSHETGAGTLQLTFDQAVAQGLDRVTGGNLTNIVDIAFLHRHGLYRPYPIPGPPASQPETAATPEPVADPRLSTIGSTALSTVLRESTAAIPHLNASLPLSGWPRSDIGRLLKALGDAPPCPERDRLLCLAQGLDLALEARAFITAWMPQAATPAALRRVLLACVTDLGKLRPQGLSEHLDTVVLRRPDTDVYGRTALLSFILRLAAEAGINTDDEQFSNWCHRNGYEVDEVNILRRRLIAQGQARHLRLVVYLRGKSARSWPQEGGAWIFDEKTGQSTAECPPLSCAPSDKGVAELIDELLEWADSRPEGKLLNRVDIAMPARTMLSWRPEEADVGTRLGAHYEVVVHWGERIQPSQYLRRLTRLARKRLEHVEQQDEVHGCMDWMSAEVASNPAELENRRLTNAYPGALGLRFAPIGQEDFFEALLAQFPILLWPDAPVPEWDMVEEHVRDQWVNLPGGFTTAYRNAWSCPQAAVPPLARLRAAWDDHHWLEFCRTMGSHKAGIAPVGGAVPGGHG